MFRPAHAPRVEVHPAGLVQDGGGWYYEESCELSRSRLTIRIEQDRPGDWYVHEAGCEVEGLDRADRADATARFFAGRYRWLELQREKQGLRKNAAVSVLGTFLDEAGGEQRVRLGRLKNKLARQIREEEIERMWAKIRTIGFPLHGHRRGWSVCFDLMVELDEDIFE
jgi:hypothetical protein